MEFRKLQIGAGESYFFSMVIGNRMRTMVYLITIIIIFLPDWIKIALIFYYKIHCKKCCQSFFFYFHQPAYKGLKANPIPLLDSRNIRNFWIERTYFIIYGMIIITSSISWYSLSSLLCVDLMGMTALSLAAPSSRIFRKSYMWKTVEDSIRMGYRKIMGSNPGLSRCETVLWTLADVKSFFQLTFMVPQLCSFISGIHNAT